MAARPQTRRAGLGLGPRLALFVALALTLGIGVVATIAIWRETAGLIADAQVAAERDTGIIAETLGGAVRFNKPENVSPALAKLRQGQEDALAWQIALDANGAEVVRETHLSEPDPAVLSAAAQRVLTTGEPFSDAGLSAAPIRFGPENAVVGALVVGWSDAPIRAEARTRAVELAAIGVALAAAFAALGYWVLARMVARPVTGLDRCLTALAKGELDVAVPFQHAGAEIGAMARNMESLRGALAEAQAQRLRMAEVERRAVEEREAMLEALRSSVGSVVAAAEAGDFSRRVERSFDDPTLQSLAGGVNALSGVFATFLDDGETALSALSRGDLTRSMAQTYRGRLGTFADAVNATLASLAALVADLRTAEAAIGATVQDVSRDSDKLSERADMLATALQETSATMVELATTISNNADHARASADKVGDARGQADASREMIDRAVAAMKDIQSGTQEISEIVNAIDGFAFQTNLLALNAAVEAARAGEAGKGFAVVATEVRTLAQRAAEAAKDIRRLIGESRVNVDRGAGIVDQTGAALSEILTSFVGIAPAMADISSATREQSTGMSELTTALNQIDEATQLTAHLAEKGALHAQQLSAQATTLGRLVAFFKTDPRAAHGMLRAAE